MVISAFRKDIPEWVSSNWMTMCDECNCYILDNSDLGNGTTERWCSNPYCPEHLSHRVDAMAKAFGVKGIGPATAKSIIKSRKFKSPFEFIPLWFGEMKPEVSLADIAVYLSIDGFGPVSAREELSRYSSFEQYFMCCGYVRPELVPHKEILIDAQKYFKIKPPLSENIIKVWLHGSFNDYPRSRNQLLSTINKVYGRWVQIIDNGNTVAGTRFLICEDNAAVQKKVVQAAERGICRMNPNDFVGWLASEYDKFLQ